jgi:GNAT superfamily N-acetyltransferase
MEIVEFTTPEDLERAYPVMHELRHHLSPEAYNDALEAMTQRGYRLFAATDDGEVKALAGIGFGVNFYYGSYLWVYDLITTESARSKGYGAKLLSYLEDLARAEGCDTIALASALWRKDAHRFYEEKMGYEKPSYTFHKTLTEGSD